MDLKGKKLLVTGGAGFIGSHLVELLLEYDPDKIIIFDNLIRGSEENIAAAIKDSRVEFFETKGDLTRPSDLDKVCKNIDAVFHLAGLCLGYCQDNERQALEVNITGTFNLLEACVKHSIKRIVFASSSSVYGNALYSPMDEKHPFENKNFYGATKIAGEAICRAFYYKYNLDYLALRFMNAYGPRQDYLGTYVAVVIKIIDRLQQELAPVIYGDGSQAYDFVYVKDVAKSCILAMQSNISDSVYNIGSGKKTSVLDLCLLIMKIMGTDRRIEFKDFDHRALVTDRVGCPEKAKEDLGFEAQMSLAEGLKLVVDWKQSQASTNNSIQKSVHL